MVYLARFGPAPICVPLPVGPYGGIIVTNVHYGRLPVSGFLEIIPVEELFCLVL